MTKKSNTFKAVLAKVTPVGAAHDMLGLRIEEIRKAVVRKDTQSGQIIQPGVYVKEKSYVAPKWASGQTPRNRNILHSTKPIR